MSVETKEMSAASPFTVQNNGEVIFAALRNNVVFLMDGPAEEFEARCLAAGRLVAGMLRTRDRLTPGFWRADGTESESTAVALDGFAELTKVLYFSIVSATAPGDVVDLYADCDREAVLQEAQDNHLWVNALRMIYPTDEMLAGIGRWVYSVFSYEITSAARDGRPPRRVVAAYANAS